MLYLSGIILISVLLYIFLFFRHKQIPFIIFSVSGVIILFIATLFYSFRMSSIYNSNFFLRFSLVYNFATMCKLSFSEIYRMMLMGGFLVFISCVSIAFSMLQNFKKTYAILLLLPLYVYLIINDPEISFHMYLEYSTGINVIHMLNVINAYNIILVAAYLIFPIISILVYYKKTTFLIKKRYSVAMLVYTLMYYVLIFIMHAIGFIRFFILANVDIFKFHSPSVSDITVSSVIMLACIVVTVIILLTIKTSRMQNHSISAYMKNTIEIDKNLRMILHTYKNHFFAIHQQIDFLKTLDEPYSDDAKKIFDAVQEISSISMNEISDRINELKNIKMAYRPIDLNSCIESAIEKIFVPQSIKIKKEYSKEPAVVHSESRYLVEMISNLLQNSVEAITSKKGSNEEFLITIRTATETDWILLEIEDNGCGISEKEKNKIFEPLFSAKQGRNNFGMGLHYVRKVVAAHNGYIFVDSVQGKYTKFQIYLQKKRYDGEVKSLRKMMEVNSAHGTR